MVTDERVSFLATWPRMMRRDMAARYCSLPVAGFQRAVAEGTLPFAVTIAGRELWDRAALDTALDHIGGKVESWRDQQPGLNHAA